MSVVLFPAQRQDRAKWAARRLAALHHLPQAIKVAWLMPHLPRQITYQPAQLELPLGDR